LFYLLYSLLSLGKGGICLLALSGVFSRADVQKFEDCGAQGVLVGEFLMRSRNVRETIQVDRHPL